MAKKPPTKKRKGKHKLPPGLKTRAQLVREANKANKLQRELEELKVVHEQTAGSLKDRDAVIHSHKRHIEMFTQERERLMEYKRRCTAWGQLISATIALMPEPQGAAFRLLVSLLGLNRKVGEDLDSEDASQVVGHYSEAQLVNAAREAARRSPDWTVIEDDDMTNPRRAREIAAAKSSEAADQKAGLQTQEEQDTEALTL